MLIFENKNKTKLYQNILRLLSKVIQTGFFFINRKNIMVVYCFGTEFVKFTVREIKD